MENNKSSKSEDIKIFLKDYFRIDFHEIKKTLTKPAFYSNTLFILTIIYFIVKIITSLVQRTKPATSVIESIVVCLIIIAALIFQMYSAYKSGAHRYRNKEKYKEEFKKKEPVILDNNELSIAAYLEEHPEVDFETKEETIISKSGSDNLDKEPEIQELREQITDEEKLQKNPK